MKHAPQAQDDDAEARCDDVGGATVVVLYPALQRIGCGVVEHCGRGVRRDVRAVVVGKPRGRVVGMGDLEVRGGMSMKERQS